MQSKLNWIEISINNLQAKNKVKINIKWVKLNRSNKHK